MRLHHVDHGGDGPTVVLLHAFPLDSSMFDRLVPLIDGRWRVVTIDLPGLGLSPVPVARPSTDRAAAGVLDVLDDLSIAEAVVLGVSTGGYLALEIAARAPDRVSALVLVSTTPHRIEPDVPADRRQVADEVEHSRSSEPVAGSADEGLGATAHQEQPGLAGQLRDTIAAAAPDGIAWMARAIAGRSDTADVLATFPRPVLLVFGDEDTATPPARGEEMLALRDGLPARLVVLERTGHLSPLERPREVADALDGLLAQLR